MGVALSGLVAAASAAPEPWVVAGPVISPALVDPHATSGELIQVGGTTVPDTTASVKAAAADHLHAKALTYSALGASATPFGLTITPRKTPAVEAAEIAHFEAKAKALGKREADAFYGFPYAGVPSTGLPVQPLVASATPFGLTVTPRKTPAVEAAEIAHFEAKAKALGKR